MAQVDPDTAYTVFAAAFPQPSGLPFDLASSLVGLAKVESGIDPAVIGDGGISLGALQVNSTVWGSMQMPDPSMPPDQALSMEAQSQPVQAAVAGMLSTVSQMASSFRARGSSLVEAAGDDVVGWANVVWQFGADHALAWANAATSTDASGFADWLQQNLSSMTATMQQSIAGYAQRYQDFLESAAAAAGSAAAAAVNAASAGAIDIAKQAMTAFLKGLKAPAIQAAAGGLSALIGLGLGLYTIHWLSQASRRR